MAEQPKAMEFSWDELLDPKHEDERAFLPYEDIEVESRAFVAAIQAMIDRELVVTAVDARKASDAFWDANRSAREEGVASEQGRYGTRVRLINNSLVAEWYLNRFFDNAPGSGAASKKRVFSTHIEKGRGFRYPRNSFGQAKSWEKEIIEVVENRYELLRRRSQVLSKLRRSLREYERLLDKCYKGDGG